MPIKGSKQAQTVALDPGLRRSSGEPMPRGQTTIDDPGPAFSVTGIWTPTSLDRGTGKVNGPFFHDLVTMLRQLTGRPGETNGPASGTYDEQGEGQNQPRDAAIASSPLVCQ